MVSETKATVRYSFDNSLTSNILSSAYSRFKLLPHEKPSTFKFRSVKAKVGNTVVRQMNPMPRRLKGSLLSGPAPTCVLRVGELSVTPYSPSATGRIGIFRIQKDRALRTAGTVSGVSVASRDNSHAHTERQWRARVVLRIVLRILRLKNRHLQLTKSISEMKD